MTKINFEKHWAMPNKNTFDIKPIKKFIEKYLIEDEFFISIDPFANKSRLAKITNDLDPEMGCDYCMDALDFLKTFKNQSIDLVFFDAPFSPRQVSECYRRLGKTVNMETTQSSFWGNLKKEIARIVKPNGIVLSFGWNSGGIGKKLGFEMIEIQLISHGGNHNDTICTAEIKL